MHARERRHEYGESARVCDARARARTSNLTNASNVAFMAILLYLAAVGLLAAKLSQLDR